MCRPHSVAVAVCIILFCPSLIAREPTWDPVTAAELAEEKPMIEAEAPAEIISLRLEIDDRVSANRDVLKRTRIKIYDPSRISEITRISRFWNGAINRNMKIEARLTLPDGSSRVFGKHDWRERTVAEEGRANGLFGVIGSKSNWAAEEQFLAITGVVKGAILDIWEWSPNLYVSDWTMTTIQQELTPIRRFEYTNRFKNDRDTVHRIYVLNPNGGKLVDDKKEGRVSFMAENLPSIRYEPFSPPTSYFSLTLIEAYEHLWKTLASRHTLSVPLPKSVPASLGPWAYYSTKMDFYDADKGYVTKAVREKATELLLGAENQKEKARRIFHYVQSLFQRYHARADLENWYTSYVESVDELIHLDKIDSTIVREEDFIYLFVALARAAGMECHSAFHPWRTSFPFSVDLFSDWFITHQTLAVKADDGWILCDPVAERPLAFGALPWGVEGQPALLAMSQQQTFLDVQYPPAENSRADKKASLVLDAEGNLTGECVLALTGHSAQEARNLLHETGRENWWQLVRNLLDLKNSSGEARLLDVEGLETPDEPLKIRAFVRWPAYAAVIGERMMFAPSVFHQGAPPLLNESTRKTAVFFDFPHAETEAITIDLPRGLSLGAGFKPVVASSGLFSYALSVTYDHDQSRLLIQREEVNRAFDIPVANYQKARDWFRRVDAADQIGLLLHPTKSPAK